MLIEIIPNQEVKILVEGVNSKMGEEDIIEGLLDGKAYITWVMTIGKDQYHYQWIKKWKSRAPTFKGRIYIKLYGSYQPNWQCSDLG